MVDRLEKMVKKGADVNFLRNERWTPLMGCIACSSNPFIPSHMEEKVKQNIVVVARKLLELGADPNIQNDIGSTALEKAVYFQNLEAVKLLIDWGADTEIGGLHSKCLTAAVCSGYTVIAEYLITKCHNLDLPEHFECVPLRKSMKYTDDEMAKFLKIEIKDSEKLNYSIKSKDFIDARKRSYMLVNLVKQERIIRYKTKLLCTFRHIKKEGLKGSDTYNSIGHKLPEHILRCVFSML